MCKKIIAISSAVAQEIANKNVPINKIVIIYNAINIDKFPYCSHPSITDSSIILGNVSRIMPKVKGQYTLLKALKILKDKYPTILCKFAGEVSANQEMEYEELLNYVTENQLSTNVVFCGNVTDVPTFLKEINLFILPSIHEGFGISLIEAMSTGIPSIASNISGPAEIISSDAFGLLFEVDNAPDLARQIDYMITHYNEFDTKTISAYIANHFSIITMVKKHIQLYKQ